MKVCVVLFESVTVNPDKEEISDTAISPQISCVSVSSDNSLTLFATNLAIAIFLFSFMYLYLFCFKVGVFSYLKIKASVCTQLTPSLLRVIGALSGNP